MDNFQTKNPDTSGSLTERLEIPIRDENGSPIGMLVRLDETIASDHGLVCDLTRWRNTARTSFLTQFTATNERTSSWLRNVVFPNESRMLFIITGNHEDRFGHIGLNNICSSHFDIDNVLRGNASAKSGLMFYSAVSLMTWFFKSSHAPLCRLEVLSHNAAAIKLYHKLGFHEADRFPLWRTQTIDTVTYSREKSGRLSTQAPFDCIAMEISVSAFFSIHSWA